MQRQLRQLLFRKRGRQVIGTIAFYRSALISTSPVPLAL
jgi:hypothetical protein